MESLRASDPRQIGEYRLLGRLGEGGMGSVYLAQSPRGRTVAVKLVRSDLLERSDFRRRFEREVHAARRVGGEWTAPVLDAHTEADQPWLATGYIPGIPLHDAVEGQSDPLPARTVRILANRLALALGSVHEAGLIHRDVKPSNILVTIDGPRLIDFGIARALESGDDTQLTQTGAVVGSPAFMSPEQARGRQLTGASDIFSLGSALVFAATGRAPFGDTGLAAHGMLFSVAEDEPRLTGVPDGLTELLTDCLAKDPAARPGLAEIVARTADPEDEPGPGGQASNADEPWLPAGLVAQLGQHAARLLDAEVPGAREAADRAADAHGMPTAQPPDGEPEPPRVQLKPFRLEPEPPDLDSEPSGTGGGVGAGPGEVSGAGPARPAPGQDQGGREHAQGGGGERDRGQGRRSWSWRAVAGGSAVSLVLIAGGGILLAERGSVPPGVHEKSGDKKKAGGTAEPAAARVPKKYLGTWQSTVRMQNGNDPVLNRFEIRQAARGEVVAKTVNVDSHKVCEGEATLVSHDGALVVSGKNTNSYGDNVACASYGRQKLVLENGTLNWSAPNVKRSARLHRVGASKRRAVPEAMLGRWKPVGEDAGDFGFEVSFSQGRIGTAVLRFISTRKKEDLGPTGEKDCVTVESLAGVDDGAFLYGGPISDHCGDDADMTVPMIARMHGDDELRLNDGLQPDNEPVVLERAR